MDIDPKTGAFIPRLAEKWQSSPDMKEWTFFLRQGVQFHNGFGEFTAKDVVHSQLPQVAEALGIYLNQLGIEATLESLDEAKVNSMVREKATSCCLQPNIIGLRPTEEWLRLAHHSKGTGHLFEDEFLEKKYVELTQTVDPAARQQLAQEAGDHLFENFADIPLLLLFNEVVANPKVVSGWTYPGTGAGRSTHFHLLKAAR